MPTFVVGKKDETAPCFSVQLLHSGMVDIAFYEDVKPKDIFKMLRPGAKMPPEVVANAEYFQQQPGDKHLGVTLQRFLRELQQ